MTPIVTLPDFAKANLVLENLRGQINNNDLPDFGSDMLRHHSFSVETAAIITQRSRFNSKFFEPKPDSEKLLRELCFSDWIDYERRLVSERIYSRTVTGKRDVYSSKWWGNLSSSSKRAIFKAREALHKLYGRFKVDLHNCDIDFTPGETSWSSGGKVSILQKLKNRENWEVTADAFEDFCRLCYHHASLKRAAKAHFAPLSRRELGNLNFDNGNDGYLCFRARFEKMVVISLGSVGDSVPKNNEKRRFINKEPMGNMILQRVIAKKLRRSLQYDWYNHIETGQSRHRARIISDLLATIDFSNASDSIHCDLAYLLFPASLRKLLFRWRSDFVLIDDSWHQPEKLCSMGNGFCFEILTLILLSISRTLDANSSVYGDDVIIGNDYASEFTEIMSAVGFKVNEKKSFVNSPFRESCGAFYMDGVGYITSFDIHWVNSPLEFIVNCNKIKKISSDLPPGYWKEIFEETWKKLLRICPPLLMGPSVGGPLENWVENDRYMRAKRVSEISTLRSKLIEECWLALEQYQVDYSALALMTQHKFVASVLTPIPRSRNIKCPHMLGFYMYGNRCAIDRYRGNPNGITKKDRRGIWNTANFFVLPTGLVLSVKRLREEHKALLGALVLMLIKSNAQKV